MALDRAAFYDAELQRHQEHFRAALTIGPRDRVLDIGCGAGQSTREAARAAVEGSALGVDVMADMLEAARRRSAEEGLHNVTFELGDAQVRGFPKAYFDLCISRFGTMFFADPVVAFTNIGRAMRPGARLVMLVWQGRERNEWAVAIQQALAPAGISPTHVSPAFSLADRAVTARILTAAGFTSIAFAEVHEPVFYGPTVDAAYEAVVDLFLAKDGQAEPSSAIDDVHRRLRALLEAQLTADGVLFDSHAWIVTAHRA
ncbi:class I SAM-dependent methyltransferase [Sphingomonas sp.]|uniref:class I SAM-dependent methyltransferase n=1 Tax=Sphingomonas sp. TaxID=28214 RepID=UPI003D6CFC59